MDMSSTEIVPQIIVAVIITATIFFLYMACETLYTSYMRFGLTRVDVLPVTTNSIKVFKQNPCIPSNITLPTSENQLTGIEFSYSTFIYITDQNPFGNEGAAGSCGTDSPGGDTWSTLFYKGYEASPFPLCGPGVFYSASHGGNPAPTLRVVMNTYNNWFNYVDVNQITVNKWFHLAIVLRKNALYVYINGNLAAKKAFNGTMPYQNYQSLNILPGVTITDRSFFANNTQDFLHGIPPGENFIITGKTDGYVSNLTYFSYAMTYSEIMTMMNMGPSSKFDSQSLTVPPYLIDTWWTQLKN